MKKSLLLVLILSLTTTVFADLPKVDASGVTQQQNTAKNPVKPQPKKRLVKKHNTKKLIKNQNDLYFLNDTFDFVFNGDVARLPLELKQYDPSVNVLPPLGKVSNYNLYLDLQHTNLNGIQAYLSTNTNNRVKLQFNSEDNSLRLIYDSKITVARDAIDQSLKWQDGQTPSPVLDRNGLVLFPFGQYEPKVTCKPLSLCDIQLQSGEEVQSALIGDSVNWNPKDGGVQIVYSGTGAKSIPHVVLKPKEAGLETALMITTDKRTYYIKLLSAQNVNVSRAGFYYPDEEVTQVEQRRKELANEDSKIIDTDTVDPKNIHFNYKVSGDTDAAFDPVQVFDDGRRVYIQMPDDLTSKQLPALFELAPDGYTQRIINFNYKKPYYIVYKLFDEAILKYGVDDNQQMITIKRVDKKGFWASLFGG